MFPAHVNVTVNNDCMKSYLAFPTLCLGLLGEKNGLSVVSYSECNDSSSRLLNA